MNAPEHIREGADAAWRKIAYNPDRIHELADADLDALETATALMRPLAEAALVSMCGGVDHANAVLAKLRGFKQSKLMRLVAAAKKAAVTHRNPTQYQMAAFVIDAQVGCSFIAVERERRHAQRAGAVT